MIYWIISAIVWLLGAAVTYILLKINKTFERVWFSVFWPCTLFCYIVHYCYNKIINM
jgi:hypothetical protein